MIGDNETFQCMSVTEQLKSSSDLTASHLTYCSEAGLLKYQTLRGSH